MYLKFISEFGPVQLDLEKGGYRPTVPDLILVKLLSKSQLVQIPWAPALFQPSVRNLERALKKRKLKKLQPPHHLHRVEHNQAQPPNHETQVERDLQLFPVLLSRPPLLIVPETTDGNCECKHVNIAGVTEQRSSPSSEGSYYNMKRSKAFKKQPHYVRSDSCQDPTHRSINTYIHT